MEANCSEELDFSNLSETSISADYFYLPSEWIVFKIIWPFIIAFGLLSNATFVSIVARIPCMRTITNAYLVNLAVSDMIFLLSVGIHNITIYAASPVRMDRSFLAGTLSTFGCLFPELGQSICFVGSTCFVTLVSLERFLAICHPIKHHLMKGSLRTTRLITIAWIISFLTSFTTIPVFNYLKETCITWPADAKFEEYPTKIITCDASNNSILLLIIAMLPLPWFFGASVLNGILYHRILSTLNQRRSKKLSISFNDTSQTRQVAVMLITNGTIFFGCNTIMILNVIFYGIFQTNANIYPLNDTQNAIFDSAFHLSFAVNSSINPIVYSVTNKRYRQAFRSIFHGCCTGSSTKTLFEKKHHTNFAQNDESKL